MTGMRSPKETEETTVTEDKNKVDAETEEKVEDISSEAEENAEESKEEAAAQKDAKDSKADKKKVKKLEDKISELEASLAEQKDKYMRMMAEYDNFRKRSAKEKDETYSDAYSDALSHLLPIIDNLERAVGVSEADAVLKGLEMTLKGAGDALEKLGVTSFGAKGDEFDPNMHNAVMTVDSAEQSEGQIVDVFQKGYKRGDKIIRYAMVTVAN